MAGRERSESLQPSHLNTRPVTEAAPRATERSAVRSEPLARRLLRAVALLVLAIVLTLLLGLELLTSFPLLSNAVQPLFEANAESNAVGPLAGVFTLLFIVGGPIVVLLL